MSFLPDNYDEAKSAMTGSGNKYLKFADGETKIRILSKPIVGYLAWVDKQPYRVRLTETFSERFPDVTLDPSSKTKLFWAMPVYNVNEECVQILEITQKTVQESIENLASDEDWGDPTGYDLKITKSGKSLDTKYVVNPGKAAPVADDVTAMYKAAGINLDALFDGDSPFSDSDSGSTPAPAKGSDTVTEEDLPF